MTKQKRRARRPAHRVRRAITGATTLAATVMFAATMSVGHVQAQAKQPTSPPLAMSPVPIAKQVSGRTLGGSIDGSGGRDCTCRYRGADVLIGQSICMKTPSGMRQARCARYLNNTSWDITDDACAIS